MHRLLEEREKQNVLLLEEKKKQKPLPVLCLLPLASLNISKTGLE